jgi:rSAM/selenodomain-associated transferase 2
MITVVIPTLNAGSSLNPTFAALVPASVEGLVTSVIVVDGGSNDQTLDIADDAGARIINTKKGRGLQLARGGAEVKTNWILFLHADSILTPGWEAEVRSFMAAANRPGALKHAAAFRFSIDAPGIGARLMEKIVALRCRVFALPYGDQGLLISGDFYHQIGGFNPMPLMEDVDIIRRIGRKHLTLLRAPVLTSFARYRKDGYFRRIFRNLSCLALYFIGVAPARILQRYEQ